MPLNPGTRLGPYEIVSPLGAGGMGEVYKAKDTRLGRDVAIKVLPAEVATDPDRLRRFEQEARAVAALNHPNILALYDVGTHDGAPYLVTELLEGESLRELLKAGGLKVRNTLEAAVQIARGLAAAHDRGIVHRDLKPENVFLTRDGHVKILDFGLAKLDTRGPVEAAATLTTPPPDGTIPGAVMGTVGYMSPEQVRGQAVDYRSDLFAFGCVLYEMLSGRSPFRRDTAADTMSAILHEQPHALAGAGGDVPPIVAGIVKRCLEKNPADRFHSAHDLAHDLEAIVSGEAQAKLAPMSAPTRRRPVVALALVGVLVIATAGVLALRLTRSGSGSSAPRIPKIVVLPFENLGAPEDAYFASGLTEEVINRLANVHGLVVISRTTAIGYDRKGKTTRQIGVDLGVDFVLEGTVRWDHGAGRESRVRISPQLIHAEDDSNVWGDRYDRVMADIFAIQSEVGESVVRAMGVKLIPRETETLNAVATNDLEAYDLYLRGLEIANRGLDREHWQGASRLFQAAVDRDPRFAQALMWLATTHLQLNFLHLDRNHAHLDVAKTAVDRLTALGADLPETRIAHAWYTLGGELNYRKAIGEFQAALLRQPNSPLVLYGLDQVLRHEGRWVESAETSAKWLATDPRNPLALYSHGLPCMLLRRYAEADRVYGLSTSFNPRSGNSWGRRAWVQILWRGDAETGQSIVSEAGRVADLQDDLAYLGWAAFRIALMRRDLGGALHQLELNHNPALVNQFFYLPMELLRGQVYALSGQPDLARPSFGAARSKLEELISKGPDEPSRYYSSLGLACAGLGLRDEALRAAGRGVELMPASTDLWHGLWRIEDLALVEAMVGEQDKAMDHLDYLLSKTGEISTHVLRLDPRWDPLRSNPRFQALLAKYSNQA